MEEAEGVGGLRLCLIKRAKAAAAATAAAAMAAALGICGLCKVRGLLFKSAVGRRSIRRQDKTRVTRQDKKDKFYQKSVLKSVIVIISHGPNCEREEKTAASESSWSYRY